MIDAKDFECRLVRPFELGLNFMWRDIRIESTHHTRGKQPMYGRGSATSGMIKVIDTSKEFVEVRIYFPEDYKEKNPEWTYEYAQPLMQHVATILYSLGLGCLCGDIFIDETDGFCVFWSEINEVVYSCLPHYVERRLGQAEAMPKNYR